MLAITCALIAATVTSMLFASTRRIGILCVTLLCLLFPIPVLTIVLIGVAYFITQGDIYDNIKNKFK